MPRFGLTVTDATQEALRKEAKKQNMPIGNLVRRYIAEGLANDGRPVKDYDVSWGGDRRNKSENKATESEG